MTRIFKCHKQVKASAMNRLDYNNYRGWDLPSNENGDDEGYLVEYVDGVEPNDKRHAGYISWSPKEQFDNGYTETGVTNRTFGEVIEHIKKGGKAQRVGWNGKDMFLFLVSGSTFKVNRPPLLGIYPEGTEVNYCPHIDMKTADGSIVPWLASQTDMLAEDWELVL